MAVGRRNNGGHSTAGYAGRKSKVEKQLLIERLSPLEDDALETLHGAIREAKPWALRLFFLYRWGKPSETKEIQMEVKDFSIPLKNFVGNTCSESPNYFEIKSDLFHEPE